MVLLKSFFLKLMELGLGLRPYFLLRTENPIFLNFKLSDAERRLVEDCLPPGFSLTPIRFFSDEPSDSFWVSYNLYHVRYPSQRLARIRKTRCEINTFVTDEFGRKGIYVFAGSPYVSKERTSKGVGWIADLAERFVIWIYGTGRMLMMDFELTPNRLDVSLRTTQHVLEIHLPLSDGAFSCDRLSAEYLRHNDISYFNQGKTFDLVNNNSQFSLAIFHVLPVELLDGIRVTSPFFHRPPDSGYYHRGSISYLVSALNRYSRERMA